MCSPSAKIEQTELKLERPSAKERSNRAFPPAFSSIYTPGMFSGSFGFLSFCCFDL
jgi:hypothetical protein